MPSQAPFFLDAPTLEQATGAFLNNGLTVKAPAGLYSDGTIVRRLDSNGVFITLEEIPPCNPPCSPPAPIETLANASGDHNVYDMAIHTGTTGSSIGAIVIKFTLIEGVDIGVAVGVEAEIDGNEYYKVVNEDNGPLLVGSGSYDDPIIRWIDYNALLNSCYPDPITTYTGDIYDWDGYVFNDSGINLIYTADQSDVSVYSLPNPGAFFMVVPKVSAIPEILNIRAYMPCYDGTIKIEASCPALLPYIPSSVMVEDPTLDPTAYCALPLDQSIYYVKTKDLYPGFVEINTMVFKDAFGQFPLDDGYYKIPEFLNPAPGADTIYVQNGVIGSVSWDFCS